MDALNAAKAAGASWSDARIGRYRQNFVGTREKQIVQVGDTDSIGIGVRALVNGAWGFAASQTLTKDGVAAAAREAAAIAKANRIPGAAPVVLAPSPGVSERHVEERLRDRSVHDSRRAEGAAADRREHRSDEGRERQVREQLPVLHQGRPELREHRRLVHHADGDSQLGAVHGDGGVRRLQRFPIARQHGAAGGARLGVHRRGRPRRQRAQVGRRSRRKAQGQAGRRRPLRSRAASVAPLAHDSRVHRPSDRVRSRDGLRGELRRHELRRAARESARQAQVRSGVHEHPGRPHAGRRLRARSAGTTTA